MSCGSLQASLNDPMVSLDLNSNNYEMGLWTVEETSEAPFQLDMTLFAIKQQERANSKAVGTYLVFV